MPRVRVAYLLAGLALAGCGDGQSSAASAATLRIVTQPWTGWSKTQPAPTNTTHPAAPGTSIALAKAAKAPKLTIGTATGAGLEISVDNVAPMNPTGGIDLRACGSQRFRLKVGDTVKFATCSMDAGTTWTVTRAS